MERVGTQGRRKLTNKHTESNDPQKADRNVTQPTLPGPIRDKPNGNSQHRRDGIRRHRKQLRSRGLVAQLLNDSRHKQRKRIQGAITPHIDEHASIRLPILDTSPEIRHFELLMLRAGLLILFQTPDHTPPVVNGKEFGFVREILYDPEGDDADEDGDESFEDEDPSPARFPANAAHLRNCGCKQTTKGACDSGSGEEDRCTDTELAALIPAAEVVINAGKETCFSQA